MKPEKIRDIVNNHIFNAEPSIDRMINLLSEESEREIDESKVLQKCDLRTIWINAIRHLTHDEIVILIETLKAQIPEYNICNCKAEPREEIGSYTIWFCEKCNKEKNEKK